MKTTTAHAALAAALKADGYRQGPPPWLGIDARAIDRGVCLTAPCEACGRKRLTWEPWHHARAHSYVALAVCRCGHAEEF